MSNRKYRTVESTTPAAVEHEAHAFVMRHLREGGAASERIKTLLQAEFSRRGGDMLDAEIEALLLVLEEARLDRALEIKHKQALLEAKPGEPVEEPAKRRVVSAATLCNATRQLTALRAEREALQLKCEVSITLGLLDREHQRKAGEKGAMNPAHEPAAKAAEQEPEGKPAANAQRATAVVA